MELIDSLLRTRLIPLRIKERILVAVLKGQADLYLEMCLKNRLIAVREQIKRKKRFFYA